MHIKLYHTLIGLAILITIGGCKSYDVTSRYTPRYIASNTGKLAVVTPEAYELGLSILALTELAGRDTSLINTNTDYYRNFKAYFDKYKSHKAVVQLNAGLTSAKMVEQFRNGLFAFRLIDGRFALNENYRIDNSKIQFKRYAILFEDFYRDSNFEGFYSAHQSTYSQMRQKAEGLVNFDNLKSTLNKDANSFHIVVSPLMKGFAGTMDIKGMNFNECVVFPYLTPSSLVYKQAK
ncbi:DUF4932 domain-containing protein [uncultured Mucilaginibacter sp.]|uniref:DUF4932 domain-containing protein n=1 Tax=uncultured Mucilaginibacter sp. TaxID=797541 RepID=UPI0025D1A044|nr:DUF4932 domain-containing protein [uncultured Mucilaginibacter sp.]